MKTTSGANRTTNDARSRSRQPTAVRQSGFFRGGQSLTTEMQRLVESMQEMRKAELAMQNEELKRAWEVVREGLANYTDLYEFAPMGYLTLDRNGSILRVNLIGSRLLGQDRSQLVGAGLAQWFVAESRPTLDAFIADVFGGRTQETRELLIGESAGDAIVVELTGKLVDENQDCRIAMTDITERKQAERERAELQARLAQAHKLEAIGTFAAGIAHDFNNILGGILGGLSLVELKLGSDSPLGAELGEMQAMVRRGADLTKQLLGFARRGKYDVRPLDLAQVVVRTSKVFGHTHRNVSVEVDIAPRLRAVLMDHAQLEQVLLNLLANAGRAMPAGGRLIIRAENATLTSRRAARRGVAAGHFVELSIADTGVGMDAATKKQIFEPFFTTRDAGEGTGLGLASVCGIIKDHGGFIAVISELGEGTTFTLLLPATDREVVRDECQSVLRHGSGTVLIVDDEEQLVRVYARLLEALGYDVMTALSGRQAVDIVVRHGKRIALVILDMIMPDMSGGETYDALQKVAPGMKVLLSTGLSDDGQAQEVLAHGCNGIIRKPFDAATLSAKLQEFM